jgi:(p)ppGpp synthase/HD superfamily hydrolase
MIIMKEIYSHAIPLILTASIHATIAHRGQFRKGGDIPYITHPLQVARVIAAETRYPTSPELIAAAILHDVVEDTPENVDKFPEIVQQLVLLLSDLPGSHHDHRIAAIERIRNHPDAIMVKMADRYSNLIEETDFNVTYRAKESVQKSTRALLAVAKEAGLENTDTYQCLLGVFP